MGVTLGAEAVLLASAHGAVGWLSAGLGTALSGMPPSRAEVHPESRLHGKSCDGRAGCDSAGSGQGGKEARTVSRRGAEAVRGGVVLPAGSGINHTIFLGSD